MSCWFSITDCYDSYGDLNSWTCRESLIYRVSAYKGDINIRGVWDVEFTLKALKKLTKKKYGVVCEQVGNEDFVLPRDQPLMVRYPNLHSVLGILRGPSSRHWNTKFDWMFLDMFRGVEPETDPSTRKYSGAWSYLTYMVPFSEARELCQEFRDQILCLPGENHDLIALSLPAEVINNQVRDTHSMPKGEESDQPLSGRYYCHDTYGQYRVKVKDFGYVMVSRKAAGRVRARLQAQGVIR